MSINESRELGAVVVVVDKDDVDLSMDLNDGDESGKDLGVGAVPPSWIEEMGMEFIVQFILLGPRVRRTLSSYEIVAME